jgi:hypothetical protein
MSNFTLKPGLTSVFLPGVGRVPPGRVLEGDQYRRFVPAFLVEVVGTAAPAPAPTLKAVKPAVSSPPSPAPVPEPKASEAPQAPKASTVPVAPESPPTVAPGIIPPAPAASVKAEKDKKKKKG